MLQSLNPDALREYFHVGPLFRFNRQPLFRFTAVCAFLSTKAVQSSRMWRAFQKCMKQSEVSNVHANPLIGLLFELAFYDHDYKQKCKSAFAHSLSSQRGGKSMTSAFFCLLPYKYKLLLLDNRRHISALTFCSQAKVKWVLNLITDFRCLR